MDELDSGAGPLGRARRPGGGRKRAADLDPGLRPALLALVEPDKRGDPMSSLRWTTKSTRNPGGRAVRPGALGRRPPARCAAGVLNPIRSASLHSGCRGPSRPTA